MIISPPPAVKPSARPFFGLVFPNDPRIIDTVLEQTKSKYHVRPVIIGLKVSYDTSEKALTCKELSAFFPSRKMLNSKNLVYFSGPENTVLEKIPDFFKNIHKTEDDTIDILGISIDNSWVTAGNASQYLKSLDGLREKKILIVVSEKSFFETDLQLLDDAVQHSCRGTVDYVEIDIENEKNFFAHPELEPRIRILKENGINVAIGGTVTNGLGLREIERLAETFPTLSVMAHRALIKEQRFSIMEASHFYKNMVKLSNKLQ